MTEKEYRNKMLMKRILNKNSITMYYLKMIGIIRKWLESNKIFFETILAVGLTIMAIMLTLMSINISNHANQIAFYETELMKMENQPIFHFATNNVFHSDNNDSIYWEEQLTINNIGKPLKEFDCEDMIFMKIVYSESDHYAYEFVLIPINDYYYFDFPSGNLIGELADLRGYYNPKYKIFNRNAVMQADRLFSDFVQKRNASGYINIIRFIKVEYKDIFENTHTEIYFVHPLGTKTHKLKEEDGEIISDYYESFWWNESLSIDNLSPNILYDYLSTININKFKEDKISSLNWKEYN